MVHDPTAKAALHSGDSDVLGQALAQLDDKCMAEFLVLHEAFEVPVAALARLLKLKLSAFFGRYDYVGDVRCTLYTGRIRLREYLSEVGLSPADLDWHSSAAVREIGRRLKVDRTRPCAHCGESKLDMVEPRGRPREYCSNPCRQAAYRRRRAEPPELDDPERAMLPCFAGIARRIPFGIRLGLIALSRDGAIRMEQTALAGRGSTDAAQDRFLDYRWSPESPLARAARVALDHLVRRGVDLDGVYLHGRDLGGNMTPYSVGFECRYLRAMPRVFTEFGGVEWIEIPRPSRTGDLVALRIEAVDRERLAGFRWP